MNLGLLITITFMRIQIRLFSLMRIWIWILFLVKVLRICDYWSTDPQVLHFKSLKLLNFDLNADPDPALHSNADPDPASENNADPDLQPCFKQVVSNSAIRITTHVL